MWSFSAITPWFPWNYVPVTWIQSPDFGDKPSMFSLQLVNTDFKFFNFLILILPGSRDLLSRKNCSELRTSERRHHSIYSFHFNWLPRVARLEGVFNPYILDRVNIFKHVTITCNKYSISLVMLGIHRFTSSADFN